MSFYEELISADEADLKPFRAKLGQAENLFATGEEKHGQAAILRVATFAVLIHKGFKLNGSGTFNVALATSMARCLFDRLPRYDDKTKLDVMTEATYQRWMKDIPPFFHPFAFNKQSLAPNMKRKKAYDHFMGMRPDDTTKEEWSDQVLNALDNTGQARARSRAAFELACLLVARDPTGVRLREFDLDLGLLVLEADLMHQERDDNNNLITYQSVRDIMRKHRGETEPTTIRIPAVAKRQQIAQGSPEGGKDSGKAKDIRATLNQLRAAAKVPEKKEFGISKLTTARNDLVAFLTPAKAGNMTEEENKLLTEMRNLIIEHDKRVADIEKAKPENRQKAAASVVQHKARASGKKDKDGEAVNDEALKAS